MPAGKWQIVWNDEALDDLRYIRAYIAERNPAAAARVAERLATGTRLLRTTPYMGRPGRVAGTREFVFPDIPYITIYAAQEDEHIAEILRIIHTARLWPQPD